MSLRAQLNEQKKLIKSRRELLKHIFVRNNQCHHFSPDLSLSRLKNKSQSFSCGFRFENDQDRLDALHTTLHEITEEFKNDPNFVGFRFRYSGRTKYKHMVGPPVNHLLEKVDGDMRYVAISFIFTDPDY